MSPLEGIDVFVKVVQSGSFRRAARLLHMPPQTVSDRISNLERRLGVSLLYRTTRRSSITQAGKAFYDRCVAALDSVELGLQELKAASDEPSGLLRIATAPELGRIVLGSIIEEYLRRYPRVRVELKLSYATVDIIGENFDLAVRGGPLKDSTLIAKRYLDEELGLWASKELIARHGMPKNPNDLARFDFVAFAPMVEALASARGKRSPIRRPVQPRVIIDDLVAIRAFIAGGLGIGTLPGMLAGTESGNESLVRVLPSLKWPTIPIAFVYPRQLFVPPKTKAFIELALERRDATPAGRSERQRPHAIRG
jgi:DNA-binding transcriptional LysR family regulator